MRVEYNCQKIVFLRISSSYNCYGRWVTVTVTLILLVVVREELKLWEGPASGHLRS